MKPEIIQAEPLILFGLSLVKCLWGQNRKVWCFGFEVTAFVFAGDLVLFAVNVVNEIKTALRINVFTV